MPKLAQRCVFVFACLALISLADAAANGQGLMEAQAFAGEPFGVGSITLNLPAECCPSRWDWKAWA